MKYRVDKIAEIVAGKWLNTPNPTSEISTLLVDSRQLRNPDDSLFFAFKGSRQDGHSFIADLYARGVRSFVVSQMIDSINLSEANVILVDNVLDALQALAVYHRAQFDMPVIAITGSNGKTIVKEWLFQLLQYDYHIVKSPRSYNSQIGVPLSVWQLNTQSNLAIFEAGISTIGEMSNLQRIILPEIGIFTNIGSAHDEGFTSRIQKLEEKVKLFHHCRLVICCADHPNVLQVLTNRSIPLFTWSEKSEAILKVSIERLDQSTKIKFRCGKETGEIQIPFSDQASVENAIHCLALIKALHLNLPNLLSRFDGLLPIAMRLEALDGINGCLIINDVYNADLESLNVAMSFAGFQAHHPQRTIILTDLLQQAHDPDLYAKVAAQVHRFGFSTFLGVGTKIPQIQHHLKDDIESRFYETTDQLINDIDHQHFYDQLILIKGARIFGLERVANLLSHKTHQTVLEINLGALARNLKKFEAHLLDPQIKIMAMVKAAAYGSGSVEIARFLESRNIDYLAVAYVDEGIELRKAGIKTPIMVLNANLHNLGLIVEYALEPEIFSVAQLEIVAAFTKFHNLSIPIHIKVETGMNRLGLSPGDTKAVLEILRSTDRISIKSIFSHLAASDDPDQDTFTHSQIKRFVDQADPIAENVSPRPPLSFGKQQCHCPISRSAV